MSKLHPIVKYLLEQRYQQNILNEATDDGGDGGFSYNKLRKAKGPRPEDLLNMYADAAYDTVPGVKGMAQAEVPFAKKDPVAYDKARSIFAKALVDARKEAFDDRQKLIANGIADPIKVDETEILKKALAKKPELAQILTRDEYESLAGDITNPLELNISGKDEKTGNEYSKRPVTMNKWGGIDDNHAALYGFLRGAQDSLTTPEGIAMAVAGGAAFKGLGMAAQFGGGLIAPKLAPFVPASAASLVKWVPGGIARARGAEAVGSVAGQYAVNLGGAGLLAAGAIDAKQNNQLPRYFGQIAGGVGPFAVGSKTAGFGIQATPAAFAKGKAVASSAASTLKDIPGNLNTGIKELIPDFSSRIIRGKPQRFQLDTGDYLEPIDPKIPNQRSVWDTSIQDPSIYDPTTSLPSNRGSSTPAAGNQMSPGKRGAVATMAAILAARGGIPSKNVDFPTTNSAMVSVETGVPSSSPSTPRTTQSSSSSGGGGGSRAVTPPVRSQQSSVASSNSAPRAQTQTSTNTRTSGMQTQATGQSSPSKSVNVSSQIPQSKQSQAGTQTQGQNQTQGQSQTQGQNQTQGQTKTTSSTFFTPPGGGSLLPPPNKIDIKIPEENPGKPGETPILPLPMIDGSGSGRGSYDDDEQKRMKGGDISAMLQNLYQNARTIRLR